MAIPALTTLVFQAGATLKLQNASLLVQNQGSALQADGNSQLPVTFTSYADDSVAGDTNGDGSNTTPHAGDWGGIVYRSFDQVNRLAANPDGTPLFPGQIPVSGIQSQDERLKNAQGGDAISGADDIMSSLDFITINYGGGVVPATTGYRYDALELQNSALTVANAKIANAGGSGSSQAALSVDVDSLRADDSDPMGPVFRRMTFVANSLNGIYIRAELNGVAEPTNAVNFAANASNAGGVRNFVLDSPYPYLLTTPMVIGQEFLVQGGGGDDQRGGSALRPARHDGQALPGCRHPGHVVGQQRQAVEHQRRRPDLHQRVRRQPQHQPSLSNGQPNPAFKANSTQLAFALFTSIYDNLASTSYTDPSTGIITQIVAPLDSADSGGLYQPLPGQPVAAEARWGGIEVDSPSVTVINGATIQYGGGFVNTASGTTGRHALELAGAGGVAQNGTGTHVSITDNNFFDNLDVPINITANGLFAGNEAQPLLSGAPFFHLNVLQRNSDNALGVAGNSGQLEDPAQTVNAVWPGSDITYLVRSTITLGPNVFTSSLVASTPPNGTQLNPQPSPTVTLTIEAVLPGTILADGTVVPKPGISPIVKLSGSAPAGFTSTTAPAQGEEISQGAGFVSGMDNGVDPTADPLIDVGVNSQMRFLGIPGNQTTGQTQVPVILTSIHDSTVGTTARGVTMNQVIPGDTTAPAAGDWGNIIFGSHTLTSYNLYDPRQGNLIDNADIRYASRIEQIGDGIIQLYDTTGTNSYNVTAEPNYEEKLGLPLGGLSGGLGNIGQFSDQLNQMNALTISDSNFSTFRDVGFFAHPGYGAIFIPENYNGTPSRGVFEGEATASFLINDTWSNMPVGVDINYQNDASGTPQPSPAEAVVLNNTFYNNGIGLGIGAITAGNTGPVAGAQGSPPNFGASADVLSMNNIYSNSTIAGIEAQGQVTGSQSQYDLFFGNTANIQLATGVAADNWVGNFGTVLGNPEFMDPTDGNFTLLPNSAAIDSGRSELGPAVAGDMLAPISTQLLNSQTGVRNTTGRSVILGGYSTFNSQTDEVALPGDPIFQFVSEWVPTLTTSGFSGTASNPGTYNYTPISGERDQRGYLRVDDPSVANLGAGSSPFFDIGAFEYVQTFPPHVIAATAAYTDPTSSTGVSIKNIYSVGGIAGTNVAPLNIQIAFDHQIDPNTINSSTVPTDPVDQRRLQRRAVGLADQPGRQAHVQLAERHPDD